MFIELSIRQLTAILQDFLSSTDLLAFLLNELYNPPARKHYETQSTGGIGQYSAALLVTVPGPTVKVVALRIAGGARSSLSSQDSPPAGHRGLPTMAEGKGVCMLVRKGAGA
jgi:hypothetical protein